MQTHIYNSKCMFSYLRQITRLVNTLEIVLQCGGSALEGFYKLIGDLDGRSVKRKWHCRHNINEFILYSLHCMC